MVVANGMSFKLLSAFVLIAFCYAFQIKDERTFHISGRAQGTTYRISYWATDSLISKKEIDSVLLELDLSLSIYNPKSLINAFNNAPSKVKADKHLATVVRKAMSIYRATSGKFDITVYPLVTAWGFGSEKIKSLPDSAKIQSLLPLIGSDKIALEEGWLIKKVPGVKIDVNGIAQGYSVDVLYEYLKQKGVENFLVEIGGELRASGRKPNGQGMKVGIESPSEHKDADPIISKIITINDASVTTSGNYRKFVESGNKRIAHLIDPKTGYPIYSQMVSVTVVAKDAITADGYDNALMAMDVDQALRFANDKGLEAYLIYHLANGKLADTATTGFNRFLQQTAKP